MSQANDRAQIVSAARLWLGTPYRHQASTRAHGADCLGLIRGVWREVLGPEPEVAPNYSPDWSEVSKTEALWAAAKRHMKEVPVDFSRLGDVVLFRMRGDAVAKHVGLIGDGPNEMPSLIHAYSRLGVVETPITDAWARRAVAQFQLLRMI